MTSPHGAFRPPRTKRGPLVRAPILGAALLAIATLLLPVSTHAQQAPPLVDVEVEGAEILDPARIRALSGLAAERALTPRAMRKAVEALWATGLFNDVSIGARQAPGGVVGVLRVEEAPVITGLEIEGVDEVERDEVESRLPLKAGDRLLEHRLHQAALDVESLYREKGYYLADVSIDAERPGADSTRVEVRIREGRKVAIERIEFRGNEAFDDGDLEDALDTDPEGFWFWQDGEFDERKWRADLTQRLPAFYGERGYLDMRVVSDSIAVDESRGEMNLFVTVDEGPRYHVGDVEIEGNSRFSRTDLESFLTLRSGQVFDTGAIGKTQEELQNLYADDGYIYAQIRPVRDVRADTTIVDLTWRIREGDPAHVQHVDIKGNTVTHEQVIRRHLFIDPGERFRRTDVRNSLLALEGLGFFEPGIVPTTRVVDPETGDIDLTFEVQERRTGSLTLGAAVGGGTGLSGFLGYEQPNLFGQAKSGQIRWEFGSRNNNLELSYTEPVFLGSKTSLSVSAFDIDRRFINTSFRQDALGGSVRFGTPLPWDDASRLFYGYQWQRIDLESTIDGDDDRFGEQYPRTESAISLGLVRDTRLPRRHPIQGARHSLNAELAGGPLGGTVGYQKYEMETSWFAPTYNDRTVLNLKLQVGGINGTGFVPLTDQFLLGGVQFPAEGLRGYADNCVGTRLAPGDRVRGCGNDRGNAFVLLTAEHFVKITDTVYASVFYDAGDVFEEFRDVTFADLKRGAGVGLQVDLPGFGPLGLDYAYGFDRVNPSTGEPDPGWKLHFKFGNLLR
ncbi:MAG: outer membrane protein assembly factor BamA [Gemmatimonadota bacterium]|nr:outer membrane protein assembly factor BamA [Gemmatimonadota bacterium]